MKQYLKKNSHLLLILYLAVYFPAFFWVESYITPDTPYTSIYWPLVDDWIPFCEWFILPYYLWALMLVAVGLHLLFADVPAFRRYMYRIMVGFSLSILFFVLFPNGQDLRPASFPRIISAPTWYASSMPRIPIPTCCPAFMPWARCFWCLPPTTRPPCAVIGGCRRCFSCCAR